jgi:hypothetical protein
MSDEIDAEESPAEEMRAALAIAEARLDALEGTQPAGMGGLDQTKRIGDEYEQHVAEPAAYGIITDPVYLLGKNAEGTIGWVAVETFACP